MTPVKVRNIVIGEGIPKICVPIVGVTEAEILAEAQKMQEIPVDVVEWRIDWYEHALEPAMVEAFLPKLRETLGEIPLLMTFRTSKEGGEKAISMEAYKELNLSAAASGCVDLIDVEAFSGDEVVCDIIRGAHEQKVRVIASNHDFFKTPEQAEIVSRLCRMQELGADIAKIAVMPQSPRDVLTLLLATEEMHRCYATGPIITMSMSADGVISRMCGEEFGSALTFGAAGKASAPGQMGVNDLHYVLELMHRQVQ